MLPNISACPKQCQISGGLETADWKSFAYTARLSRIEAGDSASAALYEQESEQKPKANPVGHPDFLQASLNFTPSLHRVAVAAAGPFRTTYHQKLLCFRLGAPERGLRSGTPTKKHRSFWKSSTLTDTLRYKDPGRKRSSKVTLRTGTYSLFFNRMNSIMLTSPQFHSMSLKLWAQSSPILALAGSLSVTEIHFKAVLLRVNQRRNGALAARCRGTST